MTGMLEKSATPTRRGFAGRLAALAAAAPRLLAETRQEKGKRLIEQALEAIGGGAFLGIRNSVRAGRAYSFYNRQVRGLARITIYDRFEEPKPDAGPDWLPLSRREVYTEKGDYYALFLNGKGYEVTYRGAAPQPEDYMQRYRLAGRRDIFYFMRYRMDEPGLYYYYTGTEIIDNTPCDAVDITDAEGEAITVYLRQSDGLPLGQVYLRRDPKTRIPYEERSVFGRYREVGPALLPWIIRRERDGDKVFELFANSYRINVKIDSAVFSIQKGVKLLPANP